MLRRTSIVAATMFTAALSLTACNGDDTKAAATAPLSTAPSSVAASSSTSAPSSAPSSTSAATAETPSTSHISSPTVTKTVQPSPSKTSAAPQTTKAAAPAKPAGCYSSDGKSLYFEGISCGFAQNLYTAANSGASTAYSPKTGLNYRFDCNMEGGGTREQCGGGDIKGGGFVAWSN